MRAKVLTRIFTTNELVTQFKLIDEKVIRKVDIERKALIKYQQDAYKEGKIEPMIHIIERIQQAVKKNEDTPAEKIGDALELQSGVSYNNFRKDFSNKFGNFALDLYGTEEDLRMVTIEKRGEIVPARVKDEDAMILIRKNFMLNYGMPGAIENINPNKFLRLKPISEFPLMPLIPISPMTMKRWEEELKIKKKDGYRFKIDKGKAYSAGLTLMCLIVFIVLLYLLFQKDEESWVQIEKGRKKRREKEIGLY